jgi:hypothetical protein
MEFTIAADLFEMASESLPAMAAVEKRAKKMASAPSAREEADFKMSVWFGSYSKVSNKSKFPNKA